MNIVMGNDEFILYIRKQHRSCRMPNDALGKRIWEWIKKEKDGDPQAVIVEPDMRCYWGYAGTFISEYELPKTATQFSFDSGILPKLYEFLNELGEQG